MDQRADEGRIDASRAYRSVGARACARVFVWMRDGVPIPGQSGGSDFWTYTLRPADLGHRITVSVRSEKTGYVSVTRMTAPSAIVTAKK